MIYNIDLKRLTKQTDCITCSKFDKQLKKCNGLNKVCFEYDGKTQTIIDGNTKLPRRI